MTGDRQDELYVGYLDETPPGVARFTRRAVIGLLLLAAALGAGLALLLERFDEGVFEYGTVRDYEGELLVDPVPRLVVDGGPAGGYLLVSEGKHALDVDGPPALPWRPAPGVTAAVAGTLIENAEASMLETRSLRLYEPRADPRASGESTPGTVRFEVDNGSPGAGTAPPPTAGTPVVRIAPDTYGRYVGEIVDTKCYLGAMKPGRGKPHRACASLCIRGGIPAALLVRTRSGESALIHLTNTLGQPVGREVLEWVGEPVEVTGILRREDDRLILTVLPHRPAPVLSAAAGVSSYRPKPDTTAPGNDISSP